VGRDAELAELTAVVARRAVERVAFIGGEAGVGKTRLVLEAVAAAGVPMLTGQATPGALGRPFAVLAAAVEPHVRRWTSVPPELADRAGAVTELLGPISPGLGAAPGGPTSPDELVRAAGELVAALAGDAPMVVVFEDLHWADVESLEVFDRLAHVEGPTSVVGTYRPEELTARHPAGEIMARIERRQPVAHLRLRPLDADGVRALVAGLCGVEPDTRVVDTLTRRTGGNPFFLEELVLTRATGDGANLASAELPWTLADALRPRLVELPADARLVCEAASVMPAGLEFDLLARVTGLDESALIEALRTLVERGVLVETKVDRFVWRHDLLREVVAAGLLGRERRRLHERAHDALVAAESDDWSALAVHAQGAGRFAEAVAAARTGAPHHLERGASHQALQLAELGLAEVPDDAELLAVAARAAWLVGLLDDALAHTLRLRDLGRSVGDPERELEALRMAARLTWELRRPREEAAWIEEVARLAESVGEEAHAEALITVAQHHMLAGRTDTAMEWSSRALAQAEAIGSRRVHAAALVEHGSAMLVAGDAESAAAVLAQAATEAEAVGDHVAAARALHNLSGSPALLGGPERRALVERMRRQAAAAGFDTFATDLYRLKLAELALDDGDLLEARAQLDRVRGHAQMPGDHGTLMAEILLELDDEAGAERVLAQYEPNPGSTGSPAMVRVWIAARRDDGREATRLLAGVLDGEESLTESGLGLALAWNDLAAARLDPVVLARAVETIPRRGTVWPAVARLLDGWLAERSRHPEQARPILEGVLASSEGGSAPPVLRAEAHLSLARLAHVAGDRVGAAAHAEAAVALLDRWPGRRRAVALDLLESIGPSDPAVPAPTPGDLTNRETEVAALLVEGLTNGQIAERLVISTKTASVHVSNILAKLGMSTRTEIAAWAVRQGLGPA